MGTNRYTASKSRSKGRSAWAITFRHPLRTDPRTGQGLRIRRGLGTADEAEADRLVAEMNELLSNETFHNVSMKEEAERIFSNVIASAFYDGIDNLVTDSWELREQHIPLPNAADGYSKVLFVGTTGAGKTSLLRHLIGSDPLKDRFPSTSTAKTTIADIEIVTADKPYNAAITFFSEWSVRTSVRECVADACLAVWEGATEDKIVHRLLNHQDQKFRLGYILGSWRPKEEDEWDDEWDDDSATNVTETGLPTPEERSLMQAALEGYVKRIQTIADKTIQYLHQGLGDDFTNSRGENRAGIEELFDEHIHEQDDFDELVNDIVDEIQQRFDCLSTGTLHKRPNGWPELWTYKSEERDTFITQIKQFSSNHAEAFGRLLTPIVQGIRIEGAFAPLFSSEKHSLVLIDGQGLGHTPDSAISVTTHITRRFEDVDVILLIDNAQQPMQAAPLSVIRAVATSGYRKKLALAFTHFDHVKGANLPDYESRKAHVIASVTNGLRSLSNVLGQPIVRAIERNLDQCCFMIGGLDRSLKEAAGKKRNRDELERLLQFFQNATEAADDLDIAPIYDSAGLLFAVQAATKDFRERWDAMLGLGQLDGVYQEHWTRIRALSRRIAEQTNLEYDTLRPVADLLARLNESISKFLDTPIGWNKTPNSDEEEEQAIDAIRQKVFAELHSVCEYRVAIDPHSRWISAYRLHGKGSTLKRAEEIQGIYNHAAPELGAGMNSIAQSFLTETYKTVNDAIEEVDGKLKTALVS